MFNFFIVLGDEMTDDNYVKIENAKRIPNVGEVILTDKFGKSVVKEVGTSYKKGCSDAYFIRI